MKAMIYINVEQGHKKGNVVIMGVDDQKDDSFPARQGDVQ
jgi:hypothetical protein